MSTILIHMVSLGGYIKTTIKRLYGDVLYVVNNCHVLVKADESSLSNERQGLYVFQEPLYSFA